MADGEPTPNGTDTRGQPQPAEPTGPAPASEQPPPAPTPPMPDPARDYRYAQLVPPAVRRSGKADWKAPFAAWPNHFANGLTHLGRALGWLGGRLADLVRRLARLSQIKPTPLQKLAILGGLAVVGVFGALAFPGNPLGQACIIAFVPGLCIAIGILGTRWHSGQGLNAGLANTTHSTIYATLHLKRSVRYVDDRLARAQVHLESGRRDDALIEVVRAKTATELSLGATEQAFRQWESFSGEARPTPPIADNDSEFLTGSVARVEDQYTLIVNRGSEHGAKPEMVFAVLADAGEQILDPETGDVLGELPTEKLRVKLIEVQPKYSRAVTFRTYTPANVPYPALTSAGTMRPGTFDAIDESINRMLETELAETVPTREKIANAKSATDQGAPARPQVSVDVGDRVRQVR